MPYPLHSLKTQRSSGFAEDSKLFSLYNALGKVAVQKHIDTNNTLTWSWVTEKAAKLHENSSCFPSGSCIRPVV